MQNWAESWATKQEVRLEALVQERTATVTNSLEDQRKKQEQVDIVCFSLRTVAGRSSSFSSLSSSSSSFSSFVSVSFLSSFFFSFSFSPSCASPFLFPS